MKVVAAHSKILSWLKSTPVHGVLDYWVTLGLLGWNFCRNRDNSVPHTPVKIKFLFYVSFKASIHVYYTLIAKNTPVGLFFLTKVKGFSDIPVLPEKSDID